MTGRLEVLGDDGEWHEVPGVASVELRQEQPEPWAEIADEASLSVAQVRERYAAVVHAYGKAAAEAARVIATAARALRQAGLVNQDGRPIRRPDRPAWQSPYGPPPRRH
ncbi:hypothetical protein [Streptomyces cyslabdanicus]|uniref:hypothetical protein n=1 Tax=Streptomyces cyslabdanicus TaxID=1470456 RepID=UPI004043E52C